MFANNVKEFIDGSKDSVEQLYGAKIIEHFSNYAVFWLRFIGDPKKRTPEAYGLVFDPTVKTINSTSTSEIYTEMCMAHYSLFCHLAGAHFQSQNVEKIMKLEESKEKLFQHWESFETAYFHLGSVFYQTYHLWGLLFLLKGEVRKEKSGFRPPITEKVRDFLENKGQTAFSKRINDINENVKIIRDSVVHFSRLASAYFDGEFHIPFHPEQKIWLKQIEEGKWLETSRKLKADLIETENLINTLHGNLMTEFEEFLKKNRIKINY